MKKLPEPTTPLAAAVADTIRAQRHEFADKVPNVASLICPLSQLSERVRQRVATA